jgi:transposase
LRLPVSVNPVDFRNGIDGFVRIVCETLADDPFRGTAFAFRNRRSTAVMVLAYDGQGFWLCQKWH